MIYLIFSLFWKSSLRIQKQKQKQKHKKFVPSASSSSSYVDRLDIIGSKTCWASWTLPLSSSYDLLHTWVAKQMEALRDHHLKTKTKSARIRFIKRFEQSEESFFTSFERSLQALHFKISLNSLSSCLSFWVAEDPSIRDLRRETFFLAVSMSSSILLLLNLTHTMHALQQPTLACVSVCVCVCAD